MCRRARVSSVRNLTNGIELSDAGAVSESTAWANGGNGIDIGPGSTLSASATRLNEQVGIVGGVVSTISGCAAYNNGTDQISVGLGAIVERCAVRTGAGTGIVLDSSAGYRGNVISTFATGVTVSGGTDLGGNLCDGGACP